MPQMNKTTGAVQIKGTIAATVREAARERAVIRAPLGIRIVIPGRFFGWILPLAALAVHDLFAAMARREQHELCVRQVINDFSYDETKAQIDAEIAQCP